MKAGINQIDEAVDYLTAVRAIYPSRMNTLDLLADPRRGSDYDGNTRAGISDPTPTQAAQLEQHHLRQRNIRDNLVLAVHHARMVWSLVNGIASDIDTSAIAQLHRCTGGMGMDGAEEWGDPTCTALADRDYGHNAGLCSKEIRARNRWEARQQQISGAA